MHSCFPCGTHSAAPLLTFSMIADCIPDRYTLQDTQRIPRGHDQRRKLQKLASAVRLPVKAERLTVTIPAGMNLPVRRNLGPIMRMRAAQTTDERDSEDGSALRGNADRREDLPSDSRTSRGFAVLSYVDLDKLTHGNYVFRGRDPRMRRKRLLLRFLLRLWWQRHEHR